MNNLGYNLTTAAITTFGIFGMKNSQFAPNTFFFYITGIIVVSFIAGFGGEQLQGMVHRLWLWVYQKLKSKKNGMGLGNRYI